MGITTYKITEPNITAEPSRKYFGEITREDILAIDGLQAYWDFTDPTAMTLDTSNLVSQVNDLSGNDYHFTSSGTNRPEFMTDYVSFDGINDYMTVPSSSSVFKLHRADTTTCIVAMELEANSGTHAHLATAPNGSGFTGVNYYTNHGATQNSIYGVSRGVSGQNTFLSAVGYTIGDLNARQTRGYKYAEIASPEYDHFLDNTSIDSGNSSYAPNNGASTDDLTVGAFGDLSSPYDGKIFAVLIANSLLQADELALVETYFQGLMA